MYATIRRFGRVEGSPDDLARAGRALAAVLGQAPGFVACAILAADGSGCAAVGLFERRADLDAAELLVARWTAEHLAGLLPEAPQVTRGEVVAQRGI
jgi:hypothetical protein